MRAAGTVVRAHGGETVADGVAEVLAPLRNVSGGDCDVPEIPLRREIGADIQAPEIADVTSEELAATTAVELARPVESKPSRRDTCTPAPMHCCILS